MKNLSPSEMGQGNQAGGVMNLVQDSWLPFQLRDGSVETLPISAIGRPDIVDFALPRADFQGAAYQFSIGLLQTVFAPEDEIVWHDYFDQAPTVQALSQTFAKVQHAFNATGDGPLFMQDFDGLVNAKIKSVSGLLIEAPGANGIKRNTDHFIKRGIGEVMSLEMAILALFTLQLNGPPNKGCKGGRVGIRGAGPLTTLVLPRDEKTSLWQKIWLNVINQSAWCYAAPDFTDGSVFPWLAPTKTSAKGEQLYASDVHPLHMFWAMPNRIRLITTKREEICQISGKKVSQPVYSYRILGHGNNYSGSWLHPLTPYKWDPKKPQEALCSGKGQPGGITYQTWDHLTYSSDSDGQRCGAVINHFYTLCELFTDLYRQVPCLWVFGYDMDKAKIRCWYSATMPLFAAPARQQKEILKEIKLLQVLAANALWHCRRQIKAVWFDKPDDAKGDISFIDLTFWQCSEGDFFNAVADLIYSVQSTQKTLSPEAAKVWLQAVCNTCLDLFDQYVLSELGNVRSMAKRIKARQGLAGWLLSGKEIKAFIANHQIEMEKEIA